MILCFWSYPWCVARAGSNRKDRLCQSVNLSVSLSPQLQAEVLVAAAGKPSEAEEQYRSLLWIRYKTLMLSFNSDTF